MSDIMPSGDPAGAGIRWCASCWLCRHYGVLHCHDGWRRRTARAAFSTVINSEVIEHVPDSPEIWSEMWRVLGPGGILIVGTPDYGRWLWWVLEWIYGKVLPGAYAHEHITHFTREALTARLQAAGYEILDCRYVGFCEMIFKTRKPAWGEQMSCGLEVG